MKFFANTNQFLKWIPSISMKCWKIFRLLIAALLCCCFVALSVSTSNMAVALICMTSCPLNIYSGDLDWKNEQVGSKRNFFQKKFQKKCSNFFGRIFSRNLIFIDKFSLFYLIRWQLSHVQIKPFICKISNKS